jgi:hypothetical protein
MACRFAGCEKSAVGSFRKGEIVAVDITFSLAFSLAFYNRNLRSYGSSAVPWYVWCSIASVTFAMTGIHWDISWHRSIGRDSFWTPAHIMIHLCGVLAGVSCAYLILSTTFRQDSPLRKCSVGMWGFRGPLGAFIGAWGGMAMITSAPFDNWWHDAYGLDVKILSPPHIVLALGIFAVHLGALILIVGQMNRAEGAVRTRLLAAFLYVRGMMLVCLMVMLMEEATRTEMHSAHFYWLIALVTPALLAGTAQATQFRWSATIVAGIYMAFLMLMNWILPLFPAEPKLGPVFYQVKQFIPPEFPFLLIVPAFAMDLIWQRTSDWGAMKQSAVSGLAFVAVFAAVQWPFANFLMSPGARNWFFGTHYFGYYVHPNSTWRQYRFGPTEQGAALWIGCAKALLTAVVMSWFGLRAGKWMQGIRR